MELQPTGFTDRAATPPSVSICGICGSCESVGSVCDCPIHSWRRWNCSPQISQIELLPHLLGQSVKSVGALGLWDPNATVVSTAAADRTAAHRFHRSSCHPTLLCQSVESVGAVSLWDPGGTASSTAAVDFTDGVVPHGL